MEISMNQTKQDRETMIRQVVYWKKNLEKCKTFEHFKTITYHKIKVMQNCFRVGLYWQGLTHDLSKYSWTEFRAGALYWQGTRSPNDAEREAIGYSSAWLHHKGRNKHHYDYWIDYSPAKKVGFVPVKMPERYLVEMVMDRIAASKIYKKEAYTDASSLEYFNHSKEFICMHPETKKELEKLLTMLAQKGEAFTFAYIEKRVLKGRSVCLFDYVISALLGRKKDGIRV